MSFQVQHFALYFSQDQVELAKKEGEKNEAVQIAWQWLLANEGTVVFERKIKGKGAEAEQVVKASLSPLARAVEAAFRYRFLDDEAAGKKALTFLEKGIETKENLFENLSECIAHAQIFELVRPIFPASQKWLNDFAQLSDDLLAQAENADSLEKLWLISLQIVSGIVLDDASRFEAGSAAFRLAIDEQIHPEGFIKPIVENAKEAVPVFRKMLLGLGALSLAAEAAYQVGFDLWAYERRDVGLNTAASYLVYYYFYPDKWRWGTGLTETDTQAIFGEYGAFMEMLTSHHNPRGVELLLDEQRPFFSPILGGLSSLSHFKTEKRRRGWFG